MLLPDDPFHSRFGTMQIEIIDFTLGRVKNGAIGHYNSTRQDGFVTRNSSDDFLFMIMVNYARDVLSIYDRGLESEAIAAGSDSVIRVINFAVFHSIANTYLELAKYCFERLDSLNRGTYYPT